MGHSSLYSWRRHYASRSTKAIKQFGSGHSPELPLTSKQRRRRFSAQTRQRQKSSNTEIVKHRAFSWGAVQHKEEGSKVLIKLSVIVCFYLQHINTCLGSYDKKLFNLDFPIRHIRWYLLHVWHVFFLIHVIFFSFVRLLRCVKKHQLTHSLTVNPPRNPAYSLRGFAGQTPEEVQRMWLGHLRSLI